MSKRHWLGAGSEDSVHGRAALAMLNAVTSLEGLLPALERRHLLGALLAAQPLPSGRAAPVALLQPLLCPQRQLDPFLRNRIAGLVLQVGQQSLLSVMHRAFRITHVHQKSIFSKDYNDVQADSALNAELSICKAEQR